MSHFLTRASGECFFLRSFWSSDKAAWKIPKINIGDSCIDRAGEPKTHAAPRVALPGSPRLSDVHYPSGLAGIFVLHRFPICIRFSGFPYDARKAPRKGALPPRARVAFQNSRNPGIIRAGTRCKREITCVRPSFRTRTRGDTCDRGKQPPASWRIRSTVAQFSHRFQRRYSSCCLRLGLVHTACLMYCRITRKKWLIMETTGTRNTFPSPAASKIPTTFSVATRINGHQSSGKSGEAKEVTENAFVCCTNKRSRLCWCEIPCCASLMLANYHFTHGAWKCCAYSLYARFYQEVSHAFRLCNNAQSQCFSAVIFCSFLK